MKFLAIGTVKGMCCDYGWGTHGNTKFEFFEADSMEDAKKKVLDEEDCSMFGELINSRGQPRGKSLNIYAISDEFKFDLVDLQNKDEQERQEYEKRKQREADERELKRLQEKLNSR